MGEFLEQKVMRFCKGDSQPDTGGCLTVKKPLITWSGTGCSIRQGRLGGQIAEGCLFELVGR